MAQIREIASPASQSLTQALEIEPEYMAALNNRANAKFKLEDYIGAIADYDRVMEANPGIAVVYANRGNSKEMIRDDEGACADWKKAVELGYTTANDYLKKCKKYE